MEDRINVLQEEAYKTTPLTAALKAFEALAVRKIGLVTPYIGEVNQILIRYIEAAGDYKVTSLLSFNLSRDSEVASVTVESIKEAAISMGRQDQVDLVFISCTSLRTSQVARAVEEIIKKPVTSSNLALAWHCARLAGCETDVSERFGQLFSRNIKFGN